MRHEILFCIFTAHVNSHFLSRALKNGETQIFIFFNFFFLSNAKMVQIMNGIVFALKIDKFKWLIVALYSGFLKQKMIVN